MARRCYSESMEIEKAKKGASKNCSHPPNSLKVMLVDLDARGQQETKRPKSDGELEVMQIRSKPDQTTWINKNLSVSLKEKLAAFLRKNVDLFA